MLYTSVLRLTSQFNRFTEHIVIEKLSVKFQADLCFPFFLSVIVEYEDFDFLLSKLSKLSYTLSSSTTMQKISAIAKNAKFNL